MNPTRVLLLRHAETASPEVFHGAESDVSLSERGRRQAEAVAPLLAAEKPVAVICSPMQRSLATAEPIAKACGVGLLIEPDLHERRVGALSGQRFDALSGLWSTTLQRWIDGNTLYAPEGTESFEMIRRRVLPVWHRLAERFAGKTYVVVAHGVVNKVVLFNLDMGITVADWHAFRSHNVGINELECVNEQWRLAQAGLVPEAVRQVK